MFGEIAPRMTGGNTFAQMVWQAPQQFNGGLTAKGVINGANIQTWSDGTNVAGIFGATGLMGFGTTSNTGLTLYTNGIARWAIDNSGNLTAGAGGQSFFVNTIGSFSGLLTFSAGSGAKFTSSVGINNVSPPAQPTGYGTPTGNARLASFAAATITLSQLASEVGQMVIDLKAYGIFGA